MLWTVKNHKLLLLVIENFLKTVKITIKYILQVNSLSSHPRILTGNERLGGGRNVDDQNVDRPKISERRNGLFS